MKLITLATILLYVTFCLATPAIASGSVPCAIAFGATRSVIAANPSHFKQLIDTKNCPRCDLVGANLSGKDLSSANLVDANLRGAILSQANLTQANLVGADLTGVDVTGTKLRQANLLEAKLSGVNLHQADTHDAKFSPSNLLKDNLQNLQLLQLLVTVLCTIVATIFLIPQYLENQKWKIYEFIAREVKEFETRQETINVMRMLDGDDRSIKLFPDSDNSKNKFVIVKKKGLCEALSSLEDQDLDQDIQKPRKADQAYINAAIRDNFDKVLDNLERFNNLIESKVVTKEGLINYIESWLEIIHNQADPEVKKKLWMYIEKRKFSGVQKLFERYNRPIYPQAGDDDSPSHQSNRVVMSQLAKQELTSAMQNRAD
jgi:uncharacterized protein YjbI with pentapeptide repeats